MYISNENIKVWTMSKPEVVNDIEVPLYFKEVLKQEQIYITYWGSFKRRPTFNWKEKLICVFEGTEEFRLVNFIYKKDILVG